MRWNVSVAALAASWGFIAVIVAAVELPAQALVFYRLSIAAVTVAIGLAVVRRLDLLRLNVYRGRTVAVAATLAVHWFLFFETIKLSSVAVAVLTVYTAPIFLAVLAPLVLPERRSRIALAALAPASAGLVLIALAGEGGGHARPLAIATGIGAALTYAALVIGTKQLTARLPVGTIAFWNNFIASLVLAPFALLAGRFVPEGSEIGYVVLLGAVFTALSSFVYVSLLRRVTAQAIGILAYLEPVSGALLAWAILGQPLGWPVVVGGSLIIAAGVAIIAYEPSEPPAVELPVFPRPARVE